MADWELTRPDLQVLVGHEAAVGCVAYPASVSDTAASGGEDGQLIVWDVCTGSWPLKEGVLLILIMVVPVICT